MNKHYLLLFMIGCYIIPISYVYYQYNSNPSVSSIICDDNCKHVILFYMFLMGGGTLLYEIERHDTWSIIIISILLFGIYGLTCINETSTIHYIFATIVFIAILSFMVRHYCLTNCNILLLSLSIEIALALFVIINIYENIFYGEVLYILNFAFYYIYLHFREYFISKDENAGIKSISNIIL